MEHTYKIAGLTVNMETFGFLVDRARPYETEYMEDPDITVVGDAKNLHEKHPGIPEDFCEYTSTGMDFYEKILDFDAMLLHSSAIVMDGKAYLFSARSGTGKSTHTSLYRRYFGDERVRILNDDKPAIRLEGGRFYAYGTPWSGKTALNLNLRVPLGGICMLERGEKNEIRRLPVDKKALNLLWKQTRQPSDLKKMDKVLDLLDALLKTTPVWTMKCNMEPEAARVSYEAMSAAAE